MWLFMTFQTIASLYCTFEIQVEGSASGSIVGGNKVTKERVLSFNRFLKSKFGLRVSSISGGGLLITND